MTVKIPAPETFEPIERASVDELRALQLVRLKQTVKHAYESVDHYRKAFDAVGVSPDDVNGLEDIVKLPFTGKDDLRRGYPFSMFAVPMRDVVRVHASSGTTGKPTVVGYTRGDIDTWATLMQRSIRASGGTPDDVVHLAYGYGLFTGGLGAHYGAERLGATVIPISGGQTPRQVQLIEDFKPTIMMCTPSYMLNIADEFERQGLDPRNSSLEVGIFGAEPWTEAMRSEVEARMNLTAVDIYGLSEVIGPGVANECIETKDGPTVWEDHFYPEIIDPESGEPVPDGEPGELVFTTLTKEALPVVRYRTRDLSKLMPGSARPMRRMAKISGRTDDMLIVRGVNVFPSQIEEHLLAVEGLSPHYQLELRRDGALDVLTILTEAGESVSDDEAAVIASRLQQRVKDFAGVSATVTVGEPGSVARSEGKAVRVVDKR